MAINQEADRIHFSRHPAERPYANALNEGFDVSFADRFKQLSYWIAVPKAQIKERFGLLQEILVIFYEHPVVDARALTAINELSMERTLRQRIDKFIYLVIHKSEAGNVGDLLKQVIDRIVIPIPAAELIDPHRGSFYLRTKIAAAIGGVDLFEMSSPVKTDKEFFGREELVQVLSARALNKGESSGLFGLRKTGKTSVMFAIERRVYDSPVITLYVDCQNPGIHAMRWWQLLAELSDGLFQKSNVANDKSSFYNRHLVSADAAVAFTHDVKLLLNLTGNSLLLMLDEIEYITHGLSGALGKHWDEDFHAFWATIRSCQQETRGKLSFIVAGVNPSCVEASHFGNLQNPIFQLAVPHYLEPLRREHLREMVRTLGRYGGLDFEDDVYSHLRDIYGGHPYLVRLACSEAWKSARNLNPERNQQITKATFELLRAPIRQRLAGPIRDILLSLVWWYPEEFDLLRILASGTSDDRDFVRNYLSEKPEQVIQFARYGVLSSEGGNFVIADLQAFLIDHGLQYKQVVSPFSRTEMPQSVVATAPDLDKLALLFGQKAEVERDLRRVILLVVGSSVLFDPTKLAKALSESLKATNGRKYPADLFLGREPREVISDLYMLDLKAIIVMHWDKFKPMFKDKLRFEMNMDGINVARRADAHTTPLSGDEVKDFENSYHWMRQCLRPVIENLPRE